jgi:hypothetical protein
LKEKTHMKNTLRGKVTGIDNNSLPLQWWVLANRSTPRIHVREFDDESNPSAQVVNCDSKSVQWKTHLRLPLHM